MRAWVRAWAWAWSRVWSVGEGRGRGVYGKDLGEDMVTGVGECVYKGRGTVWTWAWARATV